MRVVLQRCSSASVSVAGEQVSAIDRGLLLLVGVKVGDSEEDARYLAEKVVHLRVFSDETGKMNHDILTTGGSILSVSQFTLYGDARKGRRPNYMNAARPDEARMRYEQFNDALRSFGVPVETGVFGAMMDISLVNDGPVTLLLDSERTF
ncbi:D-aminoacyl-tRNA deacylase [Alicyclobacillus contaminans]|uniref:D-aminoacyl-tRNA deacylase n=1 Tax=Alicyclobacillus contaminans TaxID=392016 RepID=UPI00040EE0D4|nr:D-aminoacyl-tRNA deacylase [Alicyclobacillus contaminans]GMA51950.1 D-aminoacyl-tRNA deacylase [Alicyclobacillus contaminans]